MAQPGWVFATVQAVCFDGDGDYAITDGNGWLTLSADMLQGTTPRVGDVIGVYVADATTPTLGQHLLAGSLGERLLWDHRA